MPVPEVAAPILDTDPAFAMHRGGKIELGITAPLRNREDLSLAYTPGRRPGVHGDRRRPRAG